MNLPKLSSLLFGLGLSALFVSGASAQPVAAPAPTVVYVPQLPVATDLINAANLQHLTVEKIEQGNGQITAVYRFPNGQTNTVTYVPLPAGEAEAEAAAIAAPRTAAPQAYIAGQAPVVYAQPPVVYEQAPVVYEYGPSYYPYGYGYPYGWYPGLALGFGLGWGYRGGWGHGGYGHGGYGHGGYSHGGGGHGGGGHRR